MKTLLMVEDEPDFQRIVRRILEPAGFKVLVAGSAEEGWECLAREAVQLAIVDWNLPGATGIDFCRRIRSDERHKDLPLILLTVRNLPDEQVRGLRESGADIYLTKPINPKLLLARVENLCRLLS